MDYETIILRFRDLVTDPNGTIMKHKDIIDKEGYVWWAWWNKGNENLPIGEFSEFSTCTKSENTDIYLIDSGQEKVYKASCDGIELKKNEKMRSPEPEKTPEYYKEQEYFAWFKFKSIVECDLSELHDYTYVQVDSLFGKSGPDYKKFYGKRVYDIHELIQQPRTVWFIRKQIESDPDYKIELLDANILEPEDFSTRYFETGSNSVLWLSDLHFGKTDFVVSKNNKEDAVTLTEHIRSLYPETGGLFITGDITYAGKEGGFRDAKEFVNDLNRELSQPLLSKNIIFCPGNHDFVRKEKMLGEGTPEKVAKNSVNSKAYRAFYKDIHALNPNQYLTCGKKLLMSSGRTVEIVALNSLILQQYKDFDGHGFLSQEQLEFAAEQMGWNQIGKTSSVRIAMMHHNYLPTCLAENVDVKRASSVVYDAERLMEWLQKHNVKILLHGHKHQTIVSKVGRCLNSNTLNLGETNDIYVIGMGGTGAQNCENKFATIYFNPDNVTIELYKIYSSNTEKGKKDKTIIIPI